MVCSEEERLKVAKALVDMQLSHTNAVAEEEQKMFEKVRPQI